MMRVIDRGVTVKLYVPMSPIAALPRKPPHRATRARRGRPPNGQRKIGEVYECPLHGPHLGRECPSCRKIRLQAGQTLAERRAAIRATLDRARIAEHARTLRQAAALVKVHGDPELAAAIEQFSADLESVDEIAQGIPNE